MGLCQQNCGREPEQKESRDQINVQELHNVCSSGGFSPPPQEGSREGSRGPTQVDGSEPDKCVPSNLPNTSPINLCQILSHDTTEEPAGCSVSNLI